MVWGEICHPGLGCRLTSALGVAADDGVALQGVDELQLFPSCQRQVGAALAAHRARGGGPGEHADLLVVLQDREQPGVILYLCICLCNLWGGRGRKVSGWVGRLWGEGGEKSQQRLG